MPVMCKQAVEVLAEKGLQPPALQVLVPNNLNYNCLMLQPAGPIYAGADRIGHHDDIVATLRCIRFLELAGAQGVDLAIAPEYCLPWSVLREVATGPTFPQSEKLWVLGCESATPAELSAFVQATAEQVTVIHEPVPLNGTYLNAVAFCFQTHDADGAWVRVILLQFKTCPSRDDHFLENEHLLRGNTIYRFNNIGSPLGLVAINCSDAFSVAGTPGLLEALTDRSILIHIQLNPNPRQKDFRLYRTLTFGRDSDLTNCDIICLNWAQHITQYAGGNGEPKHWNNIGGSAWYLPLNRCSTSDAEVLRNHNKGLYYCSMQEYRHALLFHYDEAVFQLTVSKPLANTAAVLINRLGPLMVNRFTWDAASSSWTEHEACLDTGFEAQLAADQDVAAAFGGIHPPGDALAVERLVALSSGEIRHVENWYKIDWLESCILEPDEVVRRITFTCDSCPKAVTYRYALLQRTGGLFHVVSNNGDWPPQVSDVAGACLSWSAQEPNYNLFKEGTQPALVVYLGEHPAPDKIRCARDGLLELLRREGRTYCNRLAVCFRRHGQLKFVQLPSLTRIDVLNSGLTDFTQVVEPDEAD